MTISTVAENIVRKQVLFCWPILHFGERCATSGTLVRKASGIRPKEGELKINFDGEDHDDDDDKDAADILGKSDNDDDHRDNDYEKLGKHEGLAAHPKEEEDHGEKW